MARKRSRLPWTYDDYRQKFTTPYGIVTLTELATLRYDLMRAKVDLAGPWAGWRIRGNKLLIPHTSLRITSESGPLFARWLRDMDRPAQSIKRGRPQLFIVR